MKKLFLTTAIILAAATSAHAVDAPSLGDRLKQNWDQNTTRNSWSDPVKSEPAFPGAVGTTQDEATTSAHKGKHHHHMSKEGHAAKKAEHKEQAVKATPEQKAKMKADRKAKWDAMTPEQKAAWKAKHAAKKAAAPAAATK